MYKLTQSFTRSASVVTFLALPLLLSSCSRFNNSGSLSLWGLALLALDIFALIDVFRQPWEIGKKILWVAIIFFFPLLGLIAYYLFAGRNSGTVR